MSEKSQVCPRCGAAMSYRLGAYECQRCGNSEAVLKAAQGAPGGPPTASKVNWHLEPHPAPAPPPRIRASETPVYGASPGLEGEKKLYFTIQAVTWAVLLVGFLAVGGALGSQVPDVGLLMVITSVAVLIVALVNLGLAYFVLFSEVAWAKWCCGLLTLIGLVSSVGKFVRNLGEMPGDEFGDPYITTVVRLVYFLVVALPVAFNIWLVSIIFRDIGNSRIDY